MPHRIPEGDLVRPVLESLANNATGFVKASDLIAAMDYATYSKKNGSVRISVCEACSVSPTIG